jgi:hypothetical protein
MQAMGTEQIEPVIQLAKWQYLHEAPMLISFKPTNRNATGNLCCILIQQTVRLRHQLLDRRSADVLQRLKTK